MDNDSPWDGPRVNRVRETPSEHYTPQALTRAEKEQARRLRDEVERLTTKVAEANAADPAAAYRRELAALVSLGSTPEEAAAILNRRRADAIADLAEGTTPLPADEAYDALVGRAQAAPKDVRRFHGYLLAPGMVVVARHRDPKECGGTEHRWFVHGSLDGGQLRATNDEGQRWSIDSLDPAGMRVVLR